MGYVGRILSTRDFWALGPFIMQSLLLLIAPALFAASIYIVLGRVILLVGGERYSLIPQKWLTKMFVTGDVISFLVQAGGGGIQAAGSLELLHAGEKIIVAGLFLQLVFFGFFVVVAGLFHFRFARADARHSPDFDVQSPAKRRGRRRAEMTQDGYATIGAHQLPWRRHMHVLYAASGLIMIRSVFRVVEYLQGNNGYLLRHEYFLYIFDAVLMLVVMCLFNWVHPAEVTDLYQKRLAARDAHVMETRDGYMQRGDA